MDDKLVNNVYTNTEGIEFNIGDFVKCHFKGYFRISGFHDYIDTFGNNIPQVDIKQEYDTYGNPRGGKKSCLADSLSHVTSESIGTTVSELRGETELHITKLVHVTT